MSRQRLPQTKQAERPLTQRQLQFVEHILTTGKPVREIAEELGTTPSNIYRELRKPHVKQHLHERTLDHIGLLAPIAARKQQELLSADSEHVQAAVAENILDRHLGKPVVRQAVAVRGAINVSIDLA